MTAAKEANQDFAMAGPRTAQTCADESMQLDDFEHPWFGILAAGKQPPSWGKADDLMPSFDPSATLGDQDPMLWRWDEIPPDQVRDSDPSRRLPKDQF
jgi:hypothetical protein